MKKLFFRKTMKKGKKNNLAAIKHKNIYGD